ncbi:hypothetical protein HDK77DRAFT_194220 [Phyllosticta capitalensis]
MHFRLPSRTSISSRLQEKDSNLGTPPTFPATRRPREFKRKWSDSQTVDDLWTAAYEDSRSDMWYKSPLLVDKIEKNSARFPAELLDWLAETNIKCSKHDFRKRFERVRPCGGGVSADFDHPGGLFDEGKGARRDLALLKSAFALSICLYDHSSDDFDGTENIRELLEGLHALRTYGDAKKGQIPSQNVYIEVYNQTRDAYEGLFEFFFQAHDFVQERHFWTKSPPQDAEIWQVTQRFRDDCAALSRRAKILQNYSDDDSDDERRLTSQFLLSIDTFELPPGDPDFVDILE